MTFTYLSPDWIIWVAIAAFLAYLSYATWIYHTTVPKIKHPDRYWLIVLRALALSLITILLFRPILITESPESKYPEVTFWIDGSGSMNRWSDPKVIESMENFILTHYSDSITIYKRYFARDIQSSPLTDPFWQSKTDLNPVLADLQEGYHMVITDGVFNDFFWMGQQMRNANVDGLIVGDTSLVNQMKIALLKNGDIQFFEGEQISVSGFIQHNEIIGKSISTELSINGKTINKNLGQHPQNATVPFSIPVHQLPPGNYPFSIKIEGSDFKAKTGTLVVKPRIKNVKIIAGNGDPLVGFLKRLLLKIGKINIEVFVQSEKYGPAFKPSAEPTDSSLFIFINPEPSIPLSIQSSFKNPIWIISSRQIPIQSLDPFIQTGFQSIFSTPTQIEWLPFLSQNEYGATSIFRFFSDLSLEEMPPLVTHLTNIPQFATSAQQITINDEPYKIPYEYQRIQTGKIAWVLHANYDLWQRWDAQRRVIPTRIEMGFTSLLEWLLLPEDIEKFNLEFQPDGSLIRPLATIDAMNFGLSSPESLLVRFEWNDQVQPMIFENGVFIGSLAINPTESFTWTVKLFANGQVLDEKKGFYQVEDSDLEKNVEYASLEPFKSWIIRQGGDFYYQQISEENLKKRLESLKTTEIKKMVIDSWLSPFIFGLIIILLTAEWILRKKYGAL